MNGFITVQEAAKKWNVTPRQVQILCKEGRITGATRMSRIWVIPEDAEKPTGNRGSTNRRKNDASMRHVRKTED